MRKPRAMLLGALAGLALLGAGTAFAQSGADTETRVIQVPKGAVVLVLPPGTLVPGAMPGPAFTGPYQLQQVSGDIHSVVVTSVSNGHGTCTRTVTSTGDAAALKVEVKTTGDAAACGTLHVAPMSSPGARDPHSIQD